MYRLATLVTAFFLLAFPALAQEARFEGLGFLPDGTAGSMVRSGSISADGSTVVGDSDTIEGIEAFRWRGGVMEGLGFLPGSNPHSRAFAVSDDGSVVVGADLYDGNYYRAFRWESGEMESLHDATICTLQTMAHGVSSDGSVAVGRCTKSDGTSEAVRWVDGEMEGLGHLPGSSRSHATAISSDGSTIVGGSSGVGAFLWTEEDGMVGLEGGTNADATGVNADGSVVVGQEFLPTLEQVAWRWEDGVRETMEHFPDGVASGVNDVSGDGSIVVGYSVVDIAGDPFDVPEASVWVKEEDGMQIRNLRQVLEEQFGLDIGGWDLQYGLGISDDGTVIIGNGINPDGVFEAWRAEAPFGQPVADEATPEALADVLSAPSPNPVHGTSTFTLAVEHGQNVSVKVFDALGRHVQTVYDGALATGMSEQLTLDASTLPGGVYVVRATGEDFVKSRQVTVVR